MKSRVMVCYPQSKTKVPVRAKIQVDIVTTAKEIGGGYFWCCLFVCLLVVCKKTA